MNYFIMFHEYVSILNKGDIFFILLRENDSKDLVYCRFKRFFFGLVAPSCSCSVKSGSSYSPSHRLSSKSHVLNQLRKLAFFWKKIWGRNDRSLFLNNKLYFLLFFFCFWRFKGTTRFFCRGGWAKVVQQRSGLYESGILTSL